MVERFKNAPLVELVAELRWEADAIIPASRPVGQVMRISPPGQHEDFFTRFSSKVGGLGYDRVERIVPPGFPVPSFQAVYRFRKKGEQQGATIYQVGGGLFTANITPPYHSWAHFRPVVERGVNCLLEVLSELGRAKPFSPLVLRYVNAFTSQYTRGHSPTSFVRDVLGFTVNLPQAVRTEMASDAEVKLHLQFAIPLKPGHQMNLVLAEGSVGGSQGLVMDLSVLADGPIAPNVEDLMGGFDDAHGVVHRTFVGVTQKLYPIMEPVE